ncbi:MAG: hypothetical protein GY795_25260 [Desulfobacterales bacterium]|nr:hypothetical protein [Desulfobacterales bacterium]
MEESRLDRIERNLEMFFQGISELKAAQQRTDEQIKAAQLKTDEQILELKASQQKTDAQQQKTDALLEKTIKKLDAIGKQLGDMGIVQGEIAEDLFHRNVKYLFREKNLHFEKVRLNLKKKGSAEYDIVAVNSGNVLVIEVKNKLTARMIDKFVSRKLPAFKQTFPEYKSCRVIGGIGALVVKDEVGRYAEDAGLFVMTQKGDGGATIINRENFSPKVFEE